MTQKSPIYAFDQILRRADGSEHPVTLTSTDGIIWRSEWQTICIPPGEEFTIGPKERTADVIDAVLFPKPVNFF